MPTVSALGRLKQKELEVKASLGVYVDREGEKKRKRGEREEEREEERGKKKGKNT